MGSGDGNNKSNADVQMQHDRRPAIQNTKKFKYHELPLHFKAMSALFHAWQKPGTLPGQARLITIAYSHYVERVRWVLDLSPLREAYTEDAHPPGLAMFAVHEVTGGAESSTPTLVLPDGEVIRDSNIILPRLHELFPTETDGLGWLYPEKRRADIEGVEQRLAEVLGAQIRQVAYTFLLDPKTWAKLSRAGGPISRHTSKVEVWMFSLVSGPIGKTMKKLMRCYNNRLEASIAAIDEIFDELSERLKTCKYLCGDTITAADITFAALGYPAVFPAEHSPVDVIDLDEIPEKWRACVDRWRATAAGQHILFLYKEHRYKSCGTCTTRQGQLVTLRQGGSRDRVPWACVLAASTLMVASMYKLSW